MTNVNEIPICINLDVFQGNARGKALPSDTSDPKEQLILNNIKTYDTKYGKVSLLKNEAYIGSIFEKGEYWDEDTLLKLKQAISPNRNILEIGGHCGTSTLVYASFLNQSQKIFVFEPQNIMFKILSKNINDNGLTNKIHAQNMGMFCYSGTSTMNGIDIDCSGGSVSKRYEESELLCNFGGIGIGDQSNTGEKINVTTVDNLSDRGILHDIGFIHCDAQGAENFIFSKAINTIKRDRPLILYENNYEHDKLLYDNVCKAYPQYAVESMFDIKQYCLRHLSYSSCIDNFNGSNDNLLIP